MAFPEGDLSGGFANPQSATSTGGLTKMEVITTEIVKGYVSRGELPATASERTRIVGLCILLAAEIGLRVTNYETQ